MIHDSLINAKWLKEFSVLPLNYSTKEIENFISIAEKIWVIPVIGYTLYEELLEQVRENKLTDVNSTALVEAIYPYLAMAVCYEALPSLWIHCSEVGLTLGSSDNSSSATLKDMTYYEQWIRRQLEARKDYCKKWLCQRFEYFPDLDVCGCGCDCCNNSAKLNTPNPNYQVYKPLNRNTNLR